MVTFFKVSKLFPRLKNEQNLYVVPIFCSTWKLVHWLHSTFYVVPLCSLSTQTSWSCSSLLLCVMHLATWPAMSLSQLLLSLSLIQSKVIGKLKPLKIEPIVYSINMIFVCFSSWALLQCFCLSVHTWATNTMDFMAVSFACCSWYALPSVHVLVSMIRFLFVHF